MFGERLFACMRNWVHVLGTVVCVCAELGACLRSWVHIWETVDCMYEALGAMYAELCACLGNGPWLARVVSQAPKLAPARGPQGLYFVQQGRPSGSPKR